MFTILVKYGVSILFNANLPMDIPIAAPIIAGSICVTIICGVYWILELCVYLVVWKIIKTK